MKKIDRLLISSFIPPFIVTFSIAMFVLVMQVLWLYIDDIAGKGLGLFFILELLGYKCVSLIPLALPLAVLISSVMVLGNMAEKYELSSLKSAGVPLLRVMRPLMLFGVSAVFFSFFTSNNLIPVANLKFGSRMYDIQKQKPSLRLDAGVFNDDFDGYAIHIKEKSGDRQIKDVLIYDHANAARGRLGQIMAKQGEMYATEDGNYFFMRLEDGHQYVEAEPSKSSGGKSYPFIRTNFKRWTKIFDLSEFNLNRRNEELFKSNRSMMTSGQLQVAADSILMKIDKREVGLANQMSNYFHYLDIDSTYLNEEEIETDRNNKKNKLQPQKPMSDSTVTSEAQVPSEQTQPLPKQTQTPNLSVSVDCVSVSRVETVGVWPNPKPKPQTQSPSEQTPTPRPTYEGRPIQQTLEPGWENRASFVELFSSEAEQDKLLGKAKSTMRSIQAHAESAVASLDRMRESHVKHIYELHTKYSMALICFIFLFIGAPMGAIVRKGGFGYPILISILFFMVFIVLTIFCRKIAETFVLPAAMAAWVPCSVLFPVGLVLTRQAMNDSKLGGDGMIQRFFAKIAQRLKRKEK